MQALSNVEVNNPDDQQSSHQQYHHRDSKAAGLFGLPSGGGGGFDGPYLASEQLSSLQLSGTGQSAASKQRQLLSGTKLVTMGDSQDKGPTSLFIFEENNFIRLKTRAIIENSVFEWTVLATIIANCVALAMEAHLPNDDKTELAIQIVST